MSDYSPGPWHVDEFSDPEASMADVGVWAGDEPICALDRTNPNQWANARLIAAAPIMLVALKAAELALEAAVRTGDPATLASVRAAIAKAEGQS